MAETSHVPQNPIASELVEEDASFADIVEQFVGGLGARLKTMEDALRAADYETLRVAAHQLKGSGGGYGYPALTDRARRLESGANRHAMEDCTEALDALRQTAARVVVGTAKSSGTGPIPSATPEPSATS